MALNDLQKLLLRYVGAQAEIDYAGFRRQFVGEFLSVAQEDEKEKLLVAAIENACVDLDEGCLEEEALKCGFRGIPITVPG